MPEDIAGAGQFGLFDGEDVDLGEVAPTDEELTAEELAAMQASIDDRSTPPPTAEGN